MSLAGTQWGPRHELALVIFVGLFVVTLPYYVRAWRGNTDLLQRAERSGLGYATMKQMLRCACAVLPTAALLLVTLVIAETTSGADGRAFDVIGEPLAGRCRSVVMGVLILAIAITNSSIFFNWPKWFVPRIFRDDRGLWHTLRE